MSRQPQSGRLKIAPTNPRRSTGHRTTAQGYGAAKPGAVSVDTGASKATGCPVLVFWALESPGADLQRFDRRGIDPAAARLSAHREEPYALTCRVRVVDGEVNFGVLRIVAAPERKRGQPGGAAVGNGIIAFEAPARTRPPKMRRALMLSTRTS